MDDWLSDPLTIPDATKPGWTIRQPSRTFPKPSWELWWSFHYATRLKLEGAVYFCGQLLGASSLPDGLGLPLLTHRLGVWHSNAFFFHLCSAYETVLQEANVIYECGLGVGEVEWRAIKPKLPTDLRELMERRRNEAWFKEVVAFRNLATHHYLVPMEKSETGLGIKPWGVVAVDARLVCVYDKSKEVVRRDVSVSREYLTRMLGHISEVWTQMAEKFK